MHLEYDHAVNRFRARWHRTADSLDKVDYKAHLTPYLIYFWNWRTGDIAIYNATIDTVTQHQTHKLDSSSSLDAMDPLDPPYEHLQIEIFGDRKIFGMADKSGVELWCFNPNFVPDELEMRRKLKRNVVFCLMLYLPGSIEIVHFRGKSARSS
ncbi:hypothetical protein VTN31DRAFT_3032 [Thermomyces dupontii]|uniref:uncharacterized protein n=1 Tax=Talaromyces thermophilus TaxID=28565 RepID=UPI003742DD09